MPLVVRRTEVYVLTDLPNSYFLALFISCYQLLKSSNSKNSKQNKRVPAAAVGPEGSSYGFLKWKVTLATLPNVSNACANEWK